jgi:hypothetical protein
MTFVLSIFKYDEKEIIQQHNHFHSSGNWHPSSYLQVKSSLLRINKQIIAGRTFFQLTYQFEIAISSFIVVYKFHILFFFIFYIDTMNQ